MRSSNDTSFKISIFRLQMNWSSVDGTFVSKARINTNSNVCNSFWNFSTSPRSTPFLFSKAMWASAFITSQYLCLMPISDDNRPAQRVRLSFFLKCDSWLTCYGCHQFPSAYTVTKECSSWTVKKTILHFAYSRHCIIDNKVQIMGCTMYLECQRLLFMNKLEPHHMRHSLCLRRHSRVFCTDQTVISAAIWLLRENPRMFPWLEFLMGAHCHLWPFQHMIIIIFIWCNKCG